MYKVGIERQALKDIARLPREYSRRISEQIDKLAEDPRPSGVKKLKGDVGYRIRVGDYRILYDIDDQAQTLTVYRVRHRKEAYR